MTDVLGPEIAFRAALALACVALYAVVMLIGGIVFLLPAPQRRIDRRAAGISKLSHSPPSAADPLVCQDLGSVDQFTVRNHEAPLLRSDRNVALRGAHVIDQRTPTLSRFPG